MKTFQDGPRDRGGGFYIVSDKPPHDLSGPYAFEYLVKHAVPDDRRQTSQEFRVGRGPEIIARYQDLMHEVGTARNVGFFFGIVVGFMIAAFLRYNHL